MQGIITFKVFKEWLKNFSYPFRMCSIKHVASNSHGVCLILGDGIGCNFGSGDIICHWTDGSTSGLYDNDLIEILNNDIIGHYTTDDGEELEY
jgi:hypothetical protein